MHDNDFETRDFHAADRHVAELIDQFADQDLCPCCAANALLLRGASLLEQAVGTSETAKTCESLAAALRQRLTLN
jgi:hypothetical protein